MADPPPQLNNVPTLDQHKSLLIPHSSSKEKPFNLVPPPPHPPPHHAIPFLLQHRQVRGPQPHLVTAVNKDEQKHVANVVQAPRKNIPRRMNSSTTSLSGGSPRQPAAGSGKHPMYRGIRSRDGKKWVSEIREPRKTSRIWLGTYPTPEMAAAAYDVATQALKGSGATLNFPDRCSSFPVPASASPNDIQSAAAGAAELMREGKTNSSTTNAGNRGDGDDGVSEFPDQEHNAGLNNNEADLFFDEEAMLRMHDLLMDMAVGLLVTPPRILSDDSPENFVVESLWSYS